MKEDDFPASCWDTLKIVGLVKSNRFNPNLDITVFVEIINITVPGGHLFCFPPVFLANYAFFSPVFLEIRLKKPK